MDVSGTLCIDTKEESQKNMTNEKTSSFYCASRCPYLRVKAGPGLPPGQRRGDESDDDELCRSILERKAWFVRWKSLMVCFSSVAVVLHGLMRSKKLLESVSWVALGGC